MEGKPGAGWGAAAGLVLATLAFGVVGPGLLIFLPFSLLLVALPPRRPLISIFGLLLAWVALVGTDPGGTPFWYIERGWVLILAAWFIFVVVSWPTSLFLPRALAALGGAVATMAVLLMILPDGWRSVDWLISQQLRGVAHDAAMIWRRSPDLHGWGSDWFLQVIGQVVEVQTLLHPALLALESIAALGVAWWGYRRLAVRERYPLGRLRDFRFGDHLIWLLVAGILLIVLPLGDVAVRTGYNLVVFMGALYALRGYAILLVVSGLQGVGGFIVTGLLLLLLYPLVLATMILVGLSDTWFDLRARRAAARPDS